MTSQTPIRGNQVREYVLNMTTDELRVWVRDDLLSWPDDQIDDFLSSEELSREEIERSSKRAATMAKAMEVATRGDGRPRDLSWMEGDDDV